jgi:hypothetical protein
MEDGCLCGFCWLAGRRGQRRLVGGTNQGRPRCDWHDGRGVSWKKQVWGGLSGLVWCGDGLSGLEWRVDGIGWDGIVEGCR